MKDSSVNARIIGDLPFDNKLERNALLVPQIRRNIVVEKWTEKRLGDDVEELSLKGYFFRARLCIERIKCFFG